MNSDAIGCSGLLFLWLLWFKHLNRDKPKLHLKLIEAPPQAHPRNTPLFCPENLRVWLDHTLFRIEQNIKTLYGMRRMCRQREGRPKYGRKFSKVFNFHNVTRSCDLGDNKGSQVVVHWVWVGTVSPPPPALARGFLSIATGLRIGQQRELPIASTSNCR